MKGDTFDYGDIVLDMVLDPPEEAVVVLITGPGCYRVQQPGDRRYDWERRFRSANQLQLVRRAQSTLELQSLYDAISEYNFALHRFQQAERWVRQAQITLADRGVK